MHVEHEEAEKCIWDFGGESCGQPTTWKT